MGDTRPARPSPPSRASGRARAVRQFTMSLMRSRGPPSNSRPRLGECSPPEYHVAPVAQGPGRGNGAVSVVLDQEDLQGRRAAGRVGRTCPRLRGPAGDRGQHEAERRPKPSRDWTQPGCPSCALGQSSGRWPKHRRARRKRPLKAGAAPARGIRRYEARRPHNNPPPPPPTARSHPVSRIRTTRGSSRAGEESRARRLSVADRQASRQRG